MRTTHPMRMSSISGFAFSAPTSDSRGRSRPVLCVDNAEPLVGQAVAGVSTIAQHQRRRLEADDGQQCRRRPCASRAQTHATSQAGAQK